MNRDRQNLYGMDVKKRFKLPGIGKNTPKYEYIPESKKIIKEKIANTENLIKNPPFLPAGKNDVSFNVNFKPAPKLWEKQALAREQVIKTESEKAFKVSKSSIIPLFRRKSELTAYPKLGRTHSLKSKNVNLKSKNAYQDAGIEKNNFDLEKRNTCNEIMNFENKHKLSKSPYVNYGNQNFSTADKQINTLINSKLSKESITNKLSKNPTFPVNNQKSITESPISRKSFSFTNNSKNITTPLKTELKLNAVNSQFSPNVRKSQISNKSMESSYQNVKIKSQPWLDDSFEERDNLHILDLNTNKSENILNENEINSVNSYHKYNTNETKLSHLNENLSNHHSENYLSNYSNGPEISNSYTQTITNKSNHSEIDSNFNGTNDNGFGSIPDEYEQVSNEVDSLYSSSEENSGIFKHNPHEITQITQDVKETSNAIKNLLIKKLKSLKIHTESLQYNVSSELFDSTPESNTDYKSLDNNTDLKNQDMKVRDPSLSSDINSGNFLSPVDPLIKHDEEMSKESLNDTDTLFKKGADLINFIRPMEEDLGNKIVTPARTPRNRKSCKDGFPSIHFNTPKADSIAERSPYSLRPRDNSVNYSLTKSRKPSVTPGRRKTMTSLYKNENETEEKSNLLTDNNEPTLKINDNNYSLFSPVENNNENEFINTNKTKSVNIDSLNSEYNESIFSPTNFSSAIKTAANQKNMTKKRSNRKTIGGTNILEIRNDVTNIPTSTSKGPKSLGTSGGIVGNQYSGSGIFSSVNSEYENTGCKENEHDACSYLPIKSITNANKNEIDTNNSNLNESSYDITWNVPSSPMDDYITSKRKSRF